MLVQLHDFLKVNQIVSKLTTNFKLREIAPISIGECAERCGWKVRCHVVITEKFIFPSSCHRYASVPHTYFTLQLVIILTTYDISVVTRRWHNSQEKIV